ncbi:NADH dehydrogenase [ubiquinone] 1 alpha subcomplex assembly factor 3 [Bulinus truncatus]|nr:NADH dehydrogenase [ubiquinone] 1 alpha subcomplex assembly factor 3 [Bulinus truncatus]
MIIQRTCFLITRNISKIASTSVRHHNFDGEAVSKSNMSMIAQDDKSMTYIQAYGRYGFRLVSGFSVLGPCIVFPRAILSWKVPSADKITPESLSLFSLLEPKLDILLIGKGDWNAKVDYSVIKYLKSHKINVEILPTEHACSTFNFLNSERRVVAAALIPPKEMISPMDEVHNKLMLDLRELEELKSMEDIHDAEMEKAMEYFNTHGYVKLKNKFLEGKEQLGEEEKNTNEKVNKKKQD